MILEKIIAATKIRVDKSKSVIPFDKMKSIAASSNKPFSFENALQSDDIDFICEVKKASPSKGIISENFDYLKIAKEYEKAGASAVSVLTEPDFFSGSNGYLTVIKQNINIPVLRKDFIIDPYQIYEAASINADAILLICSVLDTDTIAEYIKIADSLGMSCLVEAHDENEIQSAISANSRIIGVNNRNLRTFDIDIQNSIMLKKFIPDNVIFVSESGISSAADVEMLRNNGADALLIGEALMKSGDIKTELNKLRGFYDD